MSPPLVAIAALALDRIVGDPAWAPHPVVWMGRYIAWFERRFRPQAGGEHGLRWLGTALVLSTIVLFGLLPWWLIRQLHAVSPVAADILALWLTATTIAWRGLVEAGRRVHRALSDDGLEAARRAVGMIVGRDTDALDEAEVVRATVESLAENIVDAIVAPVLFACVGGAPLALLYRAVNTLDSMVGYRNARYRDFGWASARLDDVLNYIPARITAILLLVAAAVQGLDAGGALRSVRRDARRHPSPNSGIPEAAVAGALGVQLGGVNTYQGVPSRRAHLGERTRPLEREDIARAQRLVHTSALLLGLLIAMGGLMPWLLSAG